MNLLQGKKCNRGWCNKIRNGSYKLKKATNVIKYYQKKEKTECMWITFLKITEKIREMVYF